MHYRECFHVLVTGQNGTYVTGIDAAGRTLIQTYLTKGDSPQSMLHTLRQ